MKCRNCNAEIDADSVFCPECGSIIQKNQDSGKNYRGNGANNPNPKPRSKAGLFIALGVTAAVLAVVLIVLIVTKLGFPGNKQAQSIDAVSSDKIDLRGTVTSVGGNYEFELLEPGAPVSIDAKNITGQSKHLDDIYALRLESSAGEDLSKYIDDEVWINGKIRIENDVPYFYANDVSVVSSRAGIFYTGAVDAVHNDTSYLNGTLILGEDGYELELAAGSTSSICAYNQQDQEERVDKVETLLLSGGEDLDFYVGKKVWAVGKIRIYNGIPYMELDYVELD